MMALSRHAIKSNKQVSMEKKLLIVIYQPVIVILFLSLLIIHKQSVNYLNITIFNKCKVLL